MGIRGQGPLVYKVVRGGLVEKVTFKYVRVLKEAGEVTVPLHGEEHSRQRD